MTILLHDFLENSVFLLGFFVPICWWGWIGFCKYILHFRRGCDNRKCMYRCRKCPRLHSEMLQMRIARLEKRDNRNDAYIKVLKDQLQIYLDDPVLDRETESQMMGRIVKQAKAMEKAAKKADRS